MAAVRPKRITKIKNVSDMSDVADPTLSKPPPKSSATPEPDIDESMVFDPTVVSVFSGDDEDTKNIKIITDSLNKLTTNKIILELSLRAFELSEEHLTKETDLPNITVSSSGKTNKAGKIIYKVNDMPEPKPLANITKLYDYVIGIEGATLSCIRLLFKDYHPIIAERYAIQLLKSINDQFNIFGVHPIVSLAQFVAIMSTCQVLFTITDIDPSMELHAILTSLIIAQNTTQEMIPDGTKAKAFFYLYNAKKTINFIIFVEDWDYMQSDINKKNNISSTKIIGHTLMYNIRDADNIKSNSIREICKLLPTTWIDPNPIHSGLFGHDNKDYIMPDLYEGIPVQIKAKNNQYPLHILSAPVDTFHSDMYKGINQEHILAILAATVGLTSYFIQTVINLVIISEEANGNVNGDPWETPLGKYAYLDYIEKEKSKLFKRKVDVNLIKRKRILHTKLNMINDYCLNPFNQEDRQVIDERVGQLIQCKRVFEDFQVAALLGKKPVLFSQSHYNLLLLSRQEAEDLRTINGKLLEERESFIKEIRSLKEELPLLQRALIDHCNTLLTRLHSSFVQIAYAKQIIDSVNKGDFSQFTTTTVAQLPPLQKDLFLNVYIVAKEFPDIPSADVYAPRYKFDEFEYTNLEFKTAIIMCCVMTIRTLSFTKFNNDIFKLLDLLQQLVPGGETDTPPKFTMTEIPVILKIPKGAELHYYLQFIDMLTSSITELEGVKPTIKQQLPPTSVVLDSSIDHAVVAATKGSDDMFTLSSITAKATSSMYAKVSDEALKKSKEILKRFTSERDTLEFNMKSLMLKQLADEAMISVSNPRPKPSAAAAVEHYRRAQEVERITTAFYNDVEPNAKSYDATGKSLQPTTGIQWPPEDEIKLDLIHSYLSFFDTIRKQVNIVVYSSTSEEVVSNIDILFDMCSKKYIECITVNDLNLIHVFKEFIYSIRVILQYVSVAFDFPSENRTKIEDNLSLFIRLYIKFIDIDFTKLQTSKSFAHKLNIYITYKKELTSLQSIDTTQTYTLQDKLLSEVGLSRVTISSGAAERGGSYTSMKGGQFDTSKCPDTNTINKFIADRQTDDLFKHYMDHFNTNVVDEDITLTACMHKVYNYLTTEHIYVPLVRADDEPILSEILENMENQRWQFVNEYDFDNYAAHGLCIHIFGVTLYQLNNELMKGKLILPRIYPYISENIFDQHTFVIIYNIIKCLCLQFNHCLLLQYYFMALNTFIDEPYSNLFASFDEVNTRLLKKITDPNSTIFSTLYQLQLNKLTENHTVPSVEKSNMFIETITKSPITNTIPKSMEYKTISDYQLPFIENDTLPPPAPFRTEIRAGKRTHRRNRNANGKKTKRRKTIKRNTRRFKVN